MTSPSPCGRKGHRGHFLPLMKIRSNCYFKSKYYFLVNLVKIVDLSYNYNTTVETKFKKILFLKPKIFFFFKKRLVQVLANPSRLLKEPIWIKNWTNLSVNRKTEINWGLFQSLKCGKMLNSIEGIVIAILINILCLIKVLNILNTWF